MQGSQTYSLILLFRHDENAKLVIERSAHKQRRSTRAYANPQYATSKVRATTAVSSDATQARHNPPRGSGRHSPSEGFGSLPARYSHQRCLRLGTNPTCSRLGEYLVACSTSKSEARRTPLCSSTNPTQCHFHGDHVNALDRTDITDAIGRFGNAVGLGA